MPIDPSLLATGSEWQVGKIQSPGAAAPVGGSGSGSGGFGQMLAGQLGKLSALQDQAASSSQALASGQATDPSKVVMDVERARLAMQLASQIRLKAVEAMNDVFHSQV